MKSKAIKKQIGKRRKRVDDLALCPPFINGLKRLMSSMLEFHPITSSRFCCSSHAFSGWKKLNRASADSRDVFPLVRIFSNCADDSDAPCCMISLQNENKIHLNHHRKQYSGVLTSIPGQLRANDRNRMCAAAQHDWWTDKVPNKFEIAKLSRWNIWCNLDRRSHGIWRLHRNRLGCVGWAVLHPNTSIAAPTIVCSFPWWPLFRKCSIAISPMPNWMPETEASAGPSTASIQCWWQNYRLTFESVWPVNRFVANALVRRHSNRSHQLKMIKSKLKLNSVQQNAGAIRSPTALWNAGFGPSR